MRALTTLVSEPRTALIAVVTQDAVNRLIRASIQQRINLVVEKGSWAEIACADGGWSILPVGNVADSSKN